MGAKLRRLLLKNPRRAVLCLWFVIAIFCTGFAAASEELVGGGFVEKGKVVSKIGIVQNFVTDSVPGQSVRAISGRSIQSRGAPARHVGAVMAILGTLNEAGVLPAESDSRANQLIRSLIQFQSVFMKSQEPVVQEYLSSALIARWGVERTAMLNSFYEKGWTSESLEAVVEYSRQYSMWENPRIESVFHTYNLSQADWALIEQIFLEARQRFVSQNQDLHAVFARQRRGMPGGGSSRTH